MQSSKSYLPAVDGLRAISILLVIISHIGLERVIPGGLGVTIFFFISGFLITRLALGEVQTTGQLSISQFYLRRFMRLAPAFVFFICASLLFYKTIDASIPRSDILAAFLYFSNYWEMIYRFTRPVVEITGMPYKMSSPFPILWSLSIEEHFYIVFPFFFAALSSSKRRLLLVMCALCVVALIWRLYLLSHGAPAARTYFATDARIDSILYGCIFAVLMPYFYSLDFLHRRIVATLLTAASIIVILAAHVTGSFIIDEGVRYTLVGLCLFPVFIYILFHEDALPVRFLAFPALVFIGKTSYSLYLFHYLSLRIADYVSLVWMTSRYGPLWLCVFIFCTVTLTAISYLFVEHSLARWRRTNRQTKEISVNT